MFSWIRSTGYLNLCWFSGDGLCGRDGDPVDGERAGSRHRRHQEQAGLENGREAGQGTWACKGLCALNRCVLLMLIVNILKVSASLRIQIRIWSAIFRFWIRIRNWYTKWKMSFYYVLRIKNQAIDPDHHVFEKPWSRIFIQWMLICYPSLLSIFGCWHLYLFSMVRIKKFWF